MAGGGGGGGGGWAVAPVERGQIGRTGASCRSLKYLPESVRRSSLQRGVWRSWSWSTTSFRQIRCGSGSI